MRHSRLLLDVSPSRADVRMGALASALLTRVQMPTLLLKQMLFNP